LLAARYRKVEQLSRDPKDKDKDEEEVNVLRGADGSDEEEASPSIPASTELEAALAAASDAHDVLVSEVKAPPTDSPDKLTIELLSNELQALKEEFEARGKELEEATDRHLRQQAEFENFRRRTLKERQESLQFGHQNLVKDLLTTVDNLERAVEHAEQNGGGDLQSLLQGVELVQRELLGALGKHGVTTIEAEAQTFDPTYHEAMGQLPDGSVPPNTILQVLQKGYLLRERMLRPARVMVSKAAEGSASQQGQGQDGDKEPEG
jgi:molecular chaperone GrpE